jgi:hypothetical protein
VLSLVTPVRSRLAHGRHPALSQRACNLCTARFQRSEFPVAFFERARAWHGFCTEGGIRPKEDDMKKSTSVLALAGAFSLTLLTACASKEPAASPQLTAVRQSIDQAQQADAQHYATRELNMARSKLDAAEEAHEKGDEAKASDLAEQAELDAEYAAAIAQNREAQNAVNALNDTLDTLRKELNSGGDSQSGSAANPGALRQQQTLPDETSGDN